MDRAGRKIAKVALPLAALAIAASVTVLLVVTRPMPARTDAPHLGPMVEVVAVRRGDHPIAVIGHGTVLAARELEVIPQIDGAMVWHHPQLVPGGIIRRGELLFRIDPKDYRLDLEQSLAQLAEARSRLALERGLHGIAAVEWKQYKEDFAGAEVSASPLVRREPQLEAAKVSLRSSRAQVAKRRVALARTEVRAPFDAFVDEESAELGQLVSPQSVVARLVGIERFWVRGVIPVDALARIHVPGMNGDAGSRVVVRQRTGDVVVEREGRVVRLLGRLDPESRLARVLVEVDDPFGLEATEGEPPGLPLLVDAYVEIEIEGDPMFDVFEVPREALHRENAVYVFDDGVLDVREVSVAWRERDRVLVDAGLEEGERVVVSGLAQPVDGMPLRAAGRELGGDEALP